MFNRRLMAALLLAVAVFGAVCLSGCAKKLRQEAAPAPAAVTPEALPEVSVTFTDARDGKTYRVVNMPDGKTWMAENLNYAPEEGESWCYKDDEANCEKYGRLYRWETAVEACPAGWHLSSREEWDALVTYAGDDVAGTKLKSAAGWIEDDDVNGNGTDDFGFSALPGGDRYSDGSFNNAGSTGDWWTATVDDASRAYGRGMDYGDDNVDEYNIYKEYGFSVRCVGD
jgi:uncharacterized protein (TIGR02145 family)